MIRDPFRIEGPAMLSISGGRTSAYMLRRVLDAHGGTLPDDVHACFANTGKERLETLDFVHELSTRWNVPIAWVEYDGRRGGRDYREVTYETAARDGEPFDELIRRKHYVPNYMMRFCTAELKVGRLRAFMRRRAYESWVDVVGLRYDEPRRVAKTLGRNTEGDDDVTYAVPLHEARVIRADVMAFWAAQPFDLRIPGFASNCAGCFLKTPETLERVEREYPGTLQWWADHEANAGGQRRRFRPNPTFAQIIRRASLPMLPMGLDPEDGAESVACACTD